MFLSIITPFYNNLADLKRCLFLLEKQNCKDFELVLINDSSTEISPEDMTQIIQNESINIQLINNEQNSGPGYSRNQGLMMAKGDYVLFLDSDDWLDNDTVFLLHKYVEQQRYDCIIFDYLVVKKKMTPAPSVLIKVPQGILSKENALLYSTGSVWCKVYRTKILRENHVEFPCMYIKEDMVFNKKAIMCCKKIFYLKKALYYYKIHDNSLMHSKRVFDVRNDIIAFKELEDYLAQCPEILEGLFAKELLYAGTLNMLCSNTPKETIHHFLIYWTSKYPNWMHNPILVNLPTRMRIFLWGIKKMNWYLLKAVAFVKLKL